MTNLKMGYEHTLRAGEKSLLPLSTDPSEAPLYQRVLSRVTADGVQAIEAIKDYTLVECFRERDGERQLLLGLKKRGLGMNKWNGFGGKFEPGETARECALRETREECGLEPRRLVWRAQILFSFRDSGKIMRVHVFEATDFDESALMETEEMRPQWWDVDKIPYDAMWHDDTFWMPLFLAGASFEAWFDYAAGGETVNKVVEHQLCHVDAKRNSEGGIVEM